MVWGRKYKNVWNHPSRLDSKKTSPPQKNGGSPRILLCAPLSWGKNSYQLVSANHRLAFGTSFACLGSRKNGESSCPNQEFVISFQKLFWNSSPSPEFVAMIHEGSVPHWMKNRTFFIRSFTKGYASNQTKRPLVKLAISLEKVWSEEGLLRCSTSTIASRRITLILLECRTPRSCLPHLGKENAKIHPTSKGVMFNITPWRITMMESGVVGVFRFSQK